MVHHKSTFNKRIITKVLASFVGVAIFAPMTLEIAHAAQKEGYRSAPISGFHTPEAWYGKRPLLLLPLQYSSDFNVDQKQFDALMPYAEHAIQTELMETGKFSIFQANAHNPALMRAVLDDKITQDQLDTFLKSPTLENANVVLSAMQFDSPPLIAVFSLGKITTYTVPGKSNQPQTPIVQAQVTGEMYDINNTTAIQSVEMTSNLKPQNEERFWPNDRILLAIDNAAAQIAKRFVMPTPPVTLPVPVGSAYPDKIKLNNGQPITWIEPVKPAQ